MQLLPWTKKRTILVMHHAISKNLQSDFAAMHRCVKSRQSQVAFARGFAAVSSALIPRYHKILILCINRMVLFFVQGSTTLAKKIVTVEKFTRLIDGPIMWYHAISSFGSTATRLAVAARRELALQIEVDVARYHMIALRINLMNISAVTIFFWPG